MELGIGGLGYATEIGAGASAIVYRARQLDLDREVAVKVLSVTDDAFVRRFAREAKMLGKLSQNPGIVTVYDTGVTAAGQPYLILELCESSLLDRLQGPDGPFDPIAACQAAAQVADAVGDAHSNGVIHRDIKPGNVLRSQTGRHMVTDFGISIVTGTTISQTKSVGFTAGYVAPETISGESVGTPSDIYAIGATLFHMIAGKAAFVETGKQSNLLALAQRVINDPVPDLRSQGVPDEVCRIIEGAMAKRPQDRPTAAQLRDQLEAVVADLANLQVIGSGSGSAAGSASPVLGREIGSAASEMTRIGDDARQATAMAGNTAALDRPITGSDPAIVGRASSLDNHRSTAFDDSGSGFASTGGLGGPGPVAPPLGTGPPGSSTGSTGGILGDLPPDARAGGPTPPVDRRYIYTEDDRRRFGPLIVGAMVGLLALLGLGAYLMSGNGGGEDGEGDGLKIETAEGPATSLSAGGNESIGQGPGGGRGILEAGNVDDNELDNELTGSTRPGATVVVPNLAGKTATAAQSQLAGLGLMANVVQQESETVTVGTVIRQSPASGNSVASGSTITIYVATDQAAGTVQIPSVAGRTRAEAETALGALGLTVAPTVTRAFHPTVAAGLVVGSTPVAGSTVNVDSVVGLELSDGPDPGQCSDVDGLSEEMAAARLEGRGLTVSVTRRSSNSVPAGNVISCAKTGTMAALVVSSGPNVCDSAIGTDRADARAALEARGYTVSETGRPSNAGPIGQVFGCETTATAATITYVSAPLPTGCAGAAGRTVQQARTFLQAQGFTEIVTSSTPSSTVPDGQVISCAVAGSTATLTVSSGVPKVTVPDVVGLRRPGGFAALTAAGLEPGGPQEVASQKPKGEIVATQPAAGASVTPGSVVTVIISSGPASLIDVPPVIGLTQAAGVAAISGAGLTPAVALRELPKGSPNIGMVVAVNPATGTAVAVGSTVTITVGVVQPE